MQHSQKVNDERNNPDLWQVKSIKPIKSLKEVESMQEIKNLEEVRCYPEVEFVNAVTAGGSVKFLPAV